MREMNTMETCDYCGPAATAVWKATSNNSNYQLTFCNHHKNQHQSALGCNWTLTKIEEK